jgi:hypothetical protein
MKKFILLFVLLFGITFVQADMTIDYDCLLAKDGTLTTPYDWATVDNFDFNRPGWKYKGGVTVSGSNFDFAAPYLDETNYLTINSPSVESKPKATVCFREAYNYLGLFWGSVDDYNYIQFLNNGNIIAEYSGQDVIAPYLANGNQSSKHTNLYVNFYSSDNFDAVRLISTSCAFELDNLAVGTVPHTPVPGALLLGVIGISTVGLNFRRFA